MLWPQRHHLQKQGGNLSPLDRESLRLTSFGFAKAHRANKNALRTWMVLVRRSTSDTFAARIAADDLLQPDFDSCMCSDWKCTAAWILVDLHKRSLVELYEKNSHTDVSTTHILIPLSIGPRKPSFDFVWLCQSTSCEQKCASDVNGIGPSIDVWYFCGSDRWRRSLATWLWQLYVFRLKMYGSVKY